jgi:phosphoribosylaminoimidazolecarboxamide formyltransferase/IMP cyclohydrolase
VRALLSVYDKAGLTDLAKGLADLGWDLIASGNTSAALDEAGIVHRQVADVTGSPEMLGGRVKTLHPAIHGGILADRSRPEHVADLETQGIEPIDLVVCNLYPFSSDPSVELIDVGGPTMVRAAAKNFAHVGVVVSPDDYGAVLAELEAAGSLSGATRRRLARAAFAHTAAYDAAIVQWLDATDRAGAGQSDAGQSGTGETDRESVLPPSLHLSLSKAQSLRYGENPHQVGARYRVEGSASWWDGVTQHSGTALSYLNLFDTDAAWRLVHEVAELAAPDVAVAIVKHANPCGIATGSNLSEAYDRALECDPKSAFGGIVAIGGLVTAGVAERVAAGPQADVIVAEGYEPEAVERLRARRKATRLLSAPRPEALTLQLRLAGGSALVQEADRFQSRRDEWKVATKVAPTDSQWRDLQLAWLVCARTSSNAIVIVRDGQAWGIGAGQQSRVDAAEIAVTKAGEHAAGGAGASDAFFPFPDGLEVLARAGVAAVAQPGGSVGDQAVVDAADAAGIAMVMTGERHFRH